MKIGIIIGSHRQESQSAKVGQYLNGMLSAAKTDHWTLDLGKTPLPLWDESLFTEGEHWSMMDGLTQQLRDSDGFIIISPEWHGMATSGLKNFFMLLGAHSGVGHKPALLCSVSAVDGGAYVIAELRASSYKNNRLCYIPEQLVIRNVGQVFNANEADNDPDTHKYFVERARYCLTLLGGYCDALARVRAQDLVDHDTYPNGM